ncbi:hypothetical protein GGQ87_001553 [Brevundimonas alba]|uniref:Capsular biosynthesis protein n=1 Tax=Brevundimonas alba TaxID=74314 RepID=A0A7X5YJV6_9CAUL|nr:hypothetical protein [Brevundimonas alba]NJC41295.1 hypothetical protein [Brevundimonas alba]
MTARALIYSIHRMEGWWKAVGDALGYDEAVVLTDRRGCGDRWVTNDFYRAYRRLRRDKATASPLLSEADVADVIARCRVLRWLPKARAAAMALAMAEAMERVLEEVRPVVALGFPIDSYVSDVLARRARAHGVPYYELTASPLPDMCMLMHRGRLITAKAQPEPALVEARIREIADPLFTPSYVQGQAAYTPMRFIKTLGYFRLRALYFKVWSWLVNDPLNLHYLDAQPSLGHKAKWRDMRIVGMIDADWQARIEAFPRDRRVFFGLQLLPEASIDYWLDDLDLVRHEDALVELARGLTAAGYVVVVKDHPLQFGFRQTELIEALRSLPNVVIVPYEVSGNAVLAMCGVSVTATGTLGLQAGLLGNRSVVCEAYYVGSDDDFIVLRSWDDLAALPERLDLTGEPADLRARQGRTIAHLLQGSFDADFFSFQKFDPSDPNPAAAELGRRLGQRLRQLGPDGEDWHRRELPPGGGNHEGSPLR